MMIIGYSLASYPSRFIKTKDDGYMVIVGSITGLLTNHTLVSENKLKKHREKAGQSFSSPV